jgi:acyl carrier protein
LIADLFYPNKEEKLMAETITAETQIRRFILENFLYTSNEDKLRNNDSFLEEGIVDSTGILELLLFVEETFGIQVEDEEVLPDNFDSVERLTRYVQMKTG